MDKNQGKPCETCDHEEKTGGMYPCAVCRSGDKWAAKKVVGGEASEEPLFIFGESSTEAEHIGPVGSKNPLLFTPGEEKQIDEMRKGFETLGAVDTLREPTHFDGLAMRSVGAEEPPKRPASLLALADEIADSLLSWRDGSGGSKDLRKAQRILTALIMLEEGDVED